MMEFLIKNSTVASETAIAAANSYKNIVAEIEKSLNLARNASITAEDTINKVKINLIYSIIIFIYPYCSYDLNISIYCVKKKLFRQKD